MRRGILLGVALALLLTLAPTRALAAEVRQGDSVVIGPGETVDDDLYVFGGAVNVQGTVRGDVVAFGGNIVIPGAVTGDVISLGGTTVVSGQVGESVRAAGGTVDVGGPVGTDVVVAGGTVNLRLGASAGRDVVVWAGTAIVDGEVGRGVVARAGNLTVNGTVGGDVRAEVDTLTVGSAAVIGGSLVYESDREAAIAPGAQVRGQVRRIEPEPDRAEPTALARVGLTILGWLRVLVGLFALGVAFVLLFPEFSRRTTGALSGSPWASLGLGFALFVGVPVAATILFGIGLFVGGWWLGLVTLALYSIALLLSFVVAGLFLGRWILSRTGLGEVHRVWALLLGLAILTLIGLVPFLGPLTAFVALLFGLGALVLAAGRARQSAITPA